MPSKFDTPLPFTHGSEGEHAKKLSVEFQQFSLATSFYSWGTSVDAEFNVSEHEFDGLIGTEIGRLSSFANKQRSDKYITQVYMRVGPLLSAIDGNGEVPTVVLSI